MANIKCSTNLGNTIMVDSAYYLWR